MQGIRDYIEEMFQDIPPTTSNVNIKLNILENMENKYQDLIEEGLDSSIAMKSVID